MAQLFILSYSEKFVTKNQKEGTLGWVNMGNDLNTGTCFSVSSDDKLVLFVFPGIPTGDPAIVTFSLFALGLRHVRILLTNRYFQNLNTYR
jgi:hypothetical protein